MDVGIHQPWAEIVSGEIVNLCGISPAAAWMYAGDERADKANICLTDFTGCHIHDPAIDEQQVERRFSQGGFYRAAT